MHHTAFWQQLEKRPYEHDLYALLRRLESLYPMARPLGRNALPQHEPIRLGQLPSLSFAPSTIRGVRVTETAKPEVHIASFGLFGPNGPLPLHLTEYAHERLHQHRDPSLTAFTNLFHHRLISLFYRAWADQQSAVSLDRRDDAFSRYGACVSQQYQLEAPDTATPPVIAQHARLYFSGLLGNSRRSADGLQQILQGFFGISVQIKQHIPQWIPLSASQQIRLGQAQPLSSLSPLGRKIYDGQYKFRLIFGPLSQQQFQSFLPGQTHYEQVIAWVKHYIGLELAWDLQLMLDKSEVEGIRLNPTNHPLGRNSWLGERARHLPHADDVVLQC